MAADAAQWVVWIWSPGEGKKLSELLELALANEDFQFFGHVFHSVYAACLHHMV
jgi:hypothetical protein